jgi:beta-lactamase superfamily II metal-dependent hydrolase
MIGRNFGNGTDDPKLLDASSGLMCFVIQLSDGRYIVIDGGVATDSFAQGIYYALLSNAPDKDNITIAAWIITHSHSDHTGGFYRFSELYSSKVDIERFIYNFPSESDAKSFGEDINIQRVSRNIALYYPESKVNKAHTGQIYHIADAEIEVYYTVDDYAGPGRTLQSTTNYNLSSMIFSVDIAGQKIMFLGDSQDDSNNMTAHMYGDYLKSDFVQVAHHGGAGGTNSIYKAVDPMVALFTTSDALLPVYLKYSYNDYLINSLNVKEYYNSANRIKTWTLPYQPSSLGFIKN